MFVTSVCWFSPQPYRTTPLITPGAKVKRDTPIVASYLHMHPDPQVSGWRGRRRERRPEGGKDGQECARGWWERYEKRRREKERERDRERESERVNVRDGERGDREGGRGRNE